MTAPPSDQIDERMTGISVIIPTRNRPELLARCLAAIASQVSDPRDELIVVNDGGPESVPSHLPPGMSIKWVRGGGQGPAHARNCGAAQALRDILLFTDDDVIPQAGWRDSAVRALSGNAHAVGVEGPVLSPAFDPLREHSVMNEQPGAYLTCNLAVRRTAFVAIGGFDEGYPWPHCEDRDLGLRTRALGPTLFDPTMRVIHPPRAVTALSIVKRGGLVQSEWRLHHRHPATRPPRWSVRWGPLVRVIRRWQSLALRPGNRDPRRIALLLLLGGGQIAVALWTTLTKWQPSLVELKAQDRVASGKG
jgi:GT2 family glycosyltransferase